MPGSEERVNTSTQDPELGTFLAVSDTPLSRSLLRAEKLKVPIETSGPLVASAVAEFPAHPWLLHNSVWDWSLAHPQALEQKDVLAVTDRALEQTRAPWLSVHLGYSAAHVTFQNGFQVASPILERSQIVDNIIANINALKAELDVPLLLENSDYNPSGAYEYICEPEVIRTVLEATDTYFLLDLSHAQVSASRLGLTVEDYLAELPLERVRQLHVNGPRLVEPASHTLEDVHETMRETDYELLGETLEHTRPWTVTLEYRRDAALLLEQPDRLQTVLGG